MSKWYKWKGYWRRTNDDGRDGTGDLIFNTMTKIIDDKDTSHWAFNAFFQCHYLLKEGLRWPNELNLPGQAPNWWIWYVCKFFGIKKYSYRCQRDMTRDPYIAFYACYAHLKGINTYYDDVIDHYFKEIEIPWRLYSFVTWKWREQLLNDERGEVRIHLDYLREFTDVTLFDKARKIWQDD